MPITLAGHAVDKYFVEDPARANGNAVDSLTLADFASRVRTILSDQGSPAFSSMTEDQWRALASLLDLDQSGDLSVAEVESALSRLQDLAARSGNDFTPDTYKALPDWAAYLATAKFFDKTLYALFRASNDQSLDKAYFSLSRAELETAFDFLFRARSNLSREEAGAWLDNIDILGFRMQSKDVMDYLMNLFDTNADEVLSGEELVKAFDELFAAAQSSDGGADRFDLAGSSAYNVTVDGFQNYFKGEMSAFIKSFVTEIYHRYQKTIKDLQKELQRMRN